MKKSMSRRLENDYTMTRDEIEYLKGIKHPRHAYMILQREKHLAELKEKMK